MLTLADDLLTFGSTYAQDTDTTNPGVTDTQKYLMLNGIYRWYYAAFGERNSRDAADIVFPNTTASVGYVDNTLTGNTGPSIIEWRSFHLGSDETGDPLTQIELSALLAKQYGTTFPVGTSPGIPEQCAIEELAIKAGKINTYRLHLWPIPSGVSPIFARARLHPADLAAGIQVDLPTHDIYNLGLLLAADIAHLCGRDELFIGHILAPLPERVKLARAERQLAALPIPRSAELAR